MLESLERSNSFVVALDSRGEQYRYHHLFRQLLQAELTRTDPEAVVELNRRAMVWCIANERIRGFAPLRARRRRDVTSSPV